MTDTGQSAPAEMTAADILYIRRAVAARPTPAETAGLSQDSLEALYALGHRLFTAGEYEDAETAFRSLCVYDYRDSRFWMGLGATLQARNNLVMAAEIYGMAGLTSAIGDPGPFYYAAVCLFKHGDLESALATLTAMETMGRPGDPKDEAVKAKGARLMSVIQETLDKKAAKQGCR